MKVVPTFIAGEGSEALTTSFVQAIERLARDPALRARLGATARAAIVDQGLTWEKTARRVVGLAARLTESSVPDTSQAVE